MQESAEPIVVVGIRFSRVGKVYHFTANDVMDVKVGDKVVVETSRGWQLGDVAQLIPNPVRPPEGWKEIDRRATPRDLLLRQMWQMKEEEVITRARTRVAELRLSGIKIILAEYSFDGARLVILFSSESEDKYELKSLRQDMQKQYAPSQVEVRQVGPRDVAKTVCGMGACGLDTRCCCAFLTEFSSISIKMAKEQGISLTPTEITGMCGRLRCCLIYEYDTYVEARAKLPRRNKRVMTQLGAGKVVDIIPLRNSVMVEIPDVGWREFPGDDIRLMDEAGNVLGSPLPIIGVERPSVLDQAITGDTERKPFVIAANGDAPAPESPWENPPSETQPRSMPRREQRRLQRSSGDRPSSANNSRGQQSAGNATRRDGPQAGGGDAKIGDAERPGEAGDAGNANVSGNTRGNRGGSSQGNRSRGGPSGRAQNNRPSAERPNEAQPDQHEAGSEPHPQNNPRGQQPDGPSQNRNNRSGGNRTSGRAGSNRRGPEPRRGTETHDNNPDTNNNAEK